MRRPEIATAVDKLAGMPKGAIAAELNRMGHKTQFHTPYTPPAVEYWIRKQHNQRPKIVQQEFKFELAAEPQVSLPQAKPVAPSKRKLEVVAALIKLTDVLGVEEVSSLGAKILLS